MKNIFKITFDFIFIILIVFICSYFLLRLLGYAEIYKVETGSMEDNIHAGDYILIFKKNNYKVGDVVTFKKDDYFITHRIIKKDGNKVITKGDANNTEDDEISTDNIIGKVIYYGGLLNIIINYKFIIVAFLLMLYLISCYFNKEKEVK